MALSGSLNTNGYSGRYLEFSWSATQDTAKNQSKITWSLYGRGEASSGYYKAAPITVVIDGKTVLNITNRFELWNGTKVGSGTTTITHKTDGTRTFKVEVKAAIYSGSVNCTGSKTFTLDSIPIKALMVSAPDFYDDENPKITFENLIGSRASALAVCISLGGANPVDDIAYRAVGINDTQYTFNLTNAERNILRAATTGGNSRTVRFYIRTTIDGKNYTHYLARTFTIRTTQPKLNPTIKDVGSVSTSLTGNADTIIKYYNYLEINTGAAAVNGATLTSVKVVCGDKTLNAASGNLSYVESGTFTITATDNRGNTTTQIVNKTMINYFKPTLKAKMGVLNAAGSGTLDISGTFFNGSFGKVSNVLTVKYRYKEDGGTYTSWSTLTTTKSGNNYSVSKDISGLDYKKAYIFEVMVTDKICDGSNNPAIGSGEIKIKSIPVADWSKEDFNFNVPINMDGDTVLRRSGNNTVLAANGGHVYIRPSGDSDTTGEVRISSTGAIITSGDLTINGNQKAGAQTLLWVKSSNWYMLDTHKIELTENKRITNQFTGYIVIWSYYNSGTMYNACINFTYVPKLACNHNGDGRITLPLAMDTGVFGSKTLFITDDGTKTTIKGIAGNGNSPNNNWVIWKIYGY